jgi:GTP-binding protein
MFVDSAIIHVKAGDGGAGCLAFRREKYIPKGGPAGGDGGHGGDVILIADKHVRTLLDFQHKTKYQGQRGRHGLGDNKTGRSGESVTVRVPIGTTVSDQDSGEVLADLTHHGDSCVVAKGGRGGRGNARFVTPTNRAPREYEPGQEGEEKHLALELKLLADIGLVGLPNAGKSTLLSRISAARPKIADYPFTTLQPNLGIVKANSGQTFVVADIPGLIEGAHEGKGLGIRFLKHIERTRLLALLIDLNGENPKQDYTTLMNELASYNIELQKRPKVLVFTKQDLSVKAFKVPAWAKKMPHLVISAMAGTGLDVCIQTFWEMLQKTD